jgi:NADPH-dependent 2,4-dienoyl-CoA reductase/sulfur reductase-like enzyme
MAELDTEVLVVGAGPAGIAATVCAERAGARALVADMQAEPGGQIWRGQWNKATNRDAARWLGALAASPAATLFGARLVAVPRAGVALFDTQGGAVRVRYERVVVATGARELLLPFPGWTLPGVFGAGGLQVLAKNGWPVAGKRIVIGGSGPLLLAVADTLRARDAHVVLVAEQCERGALARFAGRLLGRPAKFAQAAGLFSRLATTPYRTNAWVTRVDDDAGRRRAIVRVGGRERAIDCDLVAVGYGLVPNLDVAAGFGCDVADGKVIVDDHQHTSAAGVYCAGEGTGIGGVDQALAQGEIAGYAAAGRAELAAGALARRESAQAFGRDLARTFVLRDELRGLAADDTLLCRCENVTVGAARACADAREARLMTRTGMGYCQGRVCGAAAHWLYGWNAGSPRPPFAPVRVDRLDFSNYSTPGDV